MYIKYWFGGVDTYLLPHISTSYLYLISLPHISTSYLYLTSLPHILLLVYYPSFPQILRAWAAACSSAPSLDIDPSSILLTSQSTTFADLDDLVHRALHALDVTYTWFPALIGELLS
jgi:hypothetical protein